MKKTKKKNLENLIEMCIDICCNHPNIEDFDDNLGDFGLEKGIIGMEGSSFIRDKLKISLVNIGIFNEFFSYVRIYYNDGILVLHAEICDSGIKFSNFTKIKYYKPGNWIKEVRSIYQFLNPGPQLKLQFRYSLD